MRTLCTFLLIFTIFTSLTVGQDVVVTGAEKPVEVGSLIVLKASLKVKPEGTGNVKYNWFKIQNNGLVRDNMIVSENSTELYAGTGHHAGTLNFVIVPTIQINSTFKTPENGTSISVKVIDALPPIPPVVHSDDSTYVFNFTGIVPKLPEGQFGFAQKFALRILNDNNLSSPNKVKLAKGLSSSFKNIMVKASVPGNTANFNQLLMDTNTACEAVFNLVGVSDKDSIKSDFSNIILEAYNGGKGKLNNSQSLVTAWGEAVQGFDWISNNVK